ENFASLTSVIASCPKKTVSPAFSAGQKETENLAVENKQVPCRSPDAMLRLCKVFNTDVDNSVQKRGTRSDNLSFFNTLMRFAQFLCKRIETRQDFPTAPQRKKTGSALFNEKYETTKNFLRENSIPKRY